MSRNGNGGPPNSTRGPNSNTGGGKKKKPYKGKKPKQKGKGQANKPKEREKHIHIKELEKYRITRENKATMYADYVEGLAQYAGSKSQAEWQNAISSNTEIGRNDFVTTTLNRPRPVNAAAPTWEEDTRTRQAEIEYGTQVKEQSRKWKVARDFEISLFNAILEIADDSIVNAMRKEAGFQAVETNKNLIQGLRFLGCICRKQDNGSQTDDIVDALLSCRKLTNYRQHKNSNVHDFSRSYISQYLSHEQIAGKLPFGAKIMQEVINNGVGGGMTLSQYFDKATLNGDAHRVARREMNEAYKQYVISR